MPDAPIGGSEYHPKPRYPLPPGVKGPAAVPGQGQTVPGATPGATPTGVPGTTQQSQAAPEGVVIQQNLSGQTPATSTQTPTTGKGQTATKAASSPNLLAQPGLAGVQSEIEGQGMATTSSVTGRPLFGIPALPPPGLNISGTSMSNADLGAMGDPTAIIFLIEGTLLQTFQASGQAASKMIEFLQIEQKQQTKNSIQEIQKYVKAVNDAEKISKAMGITGKVTGAINLVICLVVVIVLVVLIVACLFGGEAFEFALIPALLAALMGLGLAIDQVSGGNVTGGLGKGATQLLEAMGS
jgi:hypothetical protein